MHLRSTPKDENSAELSPGSSGSVVSEYLKKCNFKKEVIPLTESDISKGVLKKLRYSYIIWTKDTALYRSNPELFAPGAIYGLPIQG